ncbi:MAG: glycosyltransferase family 9 protein [Alphaproteobacteria bacterium]|nr:glycosyltransferase family 9 protein [Alphaproteobacteria bacterium]
MNSSVKHILFITSNRIGDAVLSSGLLDYIARVYPSARVTVACGPLVVSLFEGYPQLERIIPLQKRKRHGHWVDLWKSVVPVRWDMVVDLRNSAVSRLIRARLRFVFGPHIDQGNHKVEQMAQVMNLSDVPAPRLWFTAAQMEKAAVLIPDGGPVLGVGPSANWEGKMWPAERFAEIVRWMTGADGLMPGARVAVFGAPGEEEAARAVLERVPDGRGIDVIAKGNPGEAAAALARCSFYLGNDSGLMHCAAAAQVPVLGLFGPSKPQVYRPWGPLAFYVSTPESLDELTSYEGYDSRTCGCLMETLGVGDVQQALMRAFEENEPKKKIPA